MFLQKARAASPSNDREKSAYVRPKVIRVCGQGHMMHSSKYRKILPIYRSNVTQQCVVPFRNSTGTSTTTTSGSLDSAKQWVVTEKSWQQQTNLDVVFPYLLPKEHLNQLPKFHQSNICGGHTHLVLSRGDMRRTTYSSTTFTNSCEMLSPVLRAYNQLLAPATINCKLCLKL